MKPSIIRALLSLVQSPDIISLAGGTPDASLFPLEIFAELARKAILDEGRYSLQYGETQGWLPLREQLSSYLGPKGVAASPQEILITNGSQQGIDLINRVMLDEGDYVGVEEPSYLGALIAFNNFRARLLPLEMDVDGVLPSALEAAIQSGKKPKLLYLTPSFQNPSGRLLSQTRRKLIAELAARHDILVVEDDPYGEINFGAPYQPIKAFDQKGNVLYLGSFSKVGSPGMRLGWAAGPSELIAKMVMAKESADVCTNVLSQAIAAGFLKGGHLAGHIKTLSATYRARAFAMVEALKAETDIKFEEPKGGFFIWGRLPGNLDSTQLFQKALDLGVAYVPGSAFFVSPSGGTDSLRLTFCAVNEEKIKEGVRRLGAVIKNSGVKA
jgi:2-aminoadipate transaminase